MLGDVSCTRFRNKTAYAVRMTKQKFRQKLLFESRLGSDTASRKTGNWISHWNVPLKTVKYHQKSLQITILFIQADTDAPKTSGKITILRTWKFEQNIFKTAKRFWMVPVQEKSGQRALVQIRILCSFITVNMERPATGRVRKKNLALL